MRDLFCELLARADARDTRAATLRPDEVATWPSHLLNLLIAEDIVRQGEPARLARCPACDRGHWEEPEWVDGALFVACSEFGKTAIDPATLQRWKVSAGGIAAFTARRLKARTLSELVAGRVWKLSRIHAGGRPWLPFVVRGMGWSDRTAVIDRVTARYASALLLTFAPENAFPSSLAPAVELCELFSVSEKGIQLAWETLEECCSFAVPAASRPRSRGSDQFSTTRTGGRPAGRSIGWLLLCWIDCNHLANRLGSTRAAYEAIEKHLLAHPEPTIPVPFRLGFKAALSAARSRKGNGPCRWYRHEDGLPSELRS